MIDEELLAAHVQFGVPGGWKRLGRVGEAVDQSNEILVVLVAIGAQGIATDAQDHVLEGRIAIVDSERFGVGVEH